MADNLDILTRPETTPTIYAYEEPNNSAVRGMLKIGYTDRTAEIRVAEQFPIAKPGGKPYKIVFTGSAIYNDGSTFTDGVIHRYLRRHHVYNPEGEWFECTVNQLKSAYNAVKNRTYYEDNRYNNFCMRVEQQRAVNMTKEFYLKEKKIRPDHAPKYLWNAKMRFGKTFTAYELAKDMGFKKVLVLTFKPAVQNAWEEDLKSHVDFVGWQFICRDGLTYEQADKSKPIVCFGSFQDYLGTNSNGGVKYKNEWVHSTNWDLVIFDEYHFGAWRENAKKLFEQEDEDNVDSLDIEKYKKEEADNAFNETFLPITTSYYLFLSGTPFKALNSGEFIEDQIFNWTYSDEQREKHRIGDTPDNPYLPLPEMVMMTYKIPESIRKIAVQGEYNEFDLNVFFSTKGKESDAVFVYEEYVQKWLDLIRGAYMPATVDDLKLGSGRPPMPYSDVNLLSTITHTLWFLPNVASCYAMYNLLNKKNNVFYQDYSINICAGIKAGIGINALDPVLHSMEDPLHSKTITLSCGKLTTGVTIRPWTGIFMLRNMTSPETYFQAAFRVQSPWVTDGENNTKVIQKKQCFVFDFALDRALREIADYSCRLNILETNPEKKVEEFISFLPVLAFQDGVMTKINAEQILDIAMSGISATLLAKRWESALLVNVDNDTLSRLLGNQDAMNALLSIEGFRNLNNDIVTIINKSEEVKKAKKQDNNDLTSKQKKELSEDEKEYKSKRKMIQEKLIKFATRIPIFMYLTDYREYSIEDVIKKMEPGLFKKVTGLTVKDFDLLVSLGLFNREYMNGSIYNFKRYEDASLSYTGIDKHLNDESVGLWDTVISKYDYFSLLQEQSLLSPVKKDQINAAINNRKLGSSGKMIKAKSTLQTQNKPIVNPKIDIDLSNIKKGTIVFHRIFGDGKIVKIVGNSITVQFGNGEKRFTIPFAFTEGFLKFI